jgi:hypothetical protein
LIATAASLKRLKSHPTADDIHLVDYWETGAMTTWMVNHYVAEFGFDDDSHQCVCDRRSRRFTGGFQSFATGLRTRDVGFLVGIRGFRTVGGDKTVRSSPATCKNTVRLKSGTRQT